MSETKPARRGGTAAKPRAQALPRSREPLSSRTRRAVLPLQITLTLATGHRFAALLKECLVQAHAILSPPLRELSLALVGDRTMSDLHERFLNIPGPTDVLTFPLELDGHGRVVSGEVVVCVPEARRRARTEETRVDREVLLYALHGLLHLCGFDDRTAAGFGRMHRTEDEILTRLGVGPVFRPAPASAGPRNAPNAAGKTLKLKRLRQANSPAVRSPRPALKSSSPAPQRRTIRRGGAGTSSGAA